VNSLIGFTLNFCAEKYGAIYRVFKRGKRLYVSAQVGRDDLLARNGAPPIWDTNVGRNGDANNAVVVVENGRFIEENYGRVGTICNFNAGGFVGFIGQDGIPRY
jgi:hypothetical protein